MIRYMKYLAAIFATLIAAIALGPFWFLAPIVAFTIYFSPRVMKSKAWKLHDEAEQEAKAVKEFRKRSINWDGQL